MFHGLCHQKSKRELDPGDQHIPEQLHVYHSSIPNSFRTKGSQACFCPMLIFRQIVRCTQELKNSYPQSFVERSRHDVQAVGTDIAINDGGAMTSQCC